MSFTLVRFRDIDLPEFNPIAQAGTRASLAPRARMADGRVYDRLGDAQAQQGAGSVVYVANYYDNEPYIAETKYMALMAEVGKTGWLYRQRLATGTYERIWARLDAIDCPQDWRFPGLISNIRLTFFVVDPTWNGQRWGHYEPTFNAMRNVNTEAGLPFMPVGTYGEVTPTSGSTTTIELINGGNTIVRGVRVLANANGGVTLTGGFYLSYDASLKAGASYYTILYSNDVGASTTQMAVIDTLAKTVTNNAISPAGRMEYFAYGGNHNSDDWLALHPGSNTITIGTNTGTFPAGGVNFRFDFCEAWQ